MNPAIDGLLRRDLRLESVRSWSSISLSWQTTQKKWTSPCSWTWIKTVFRRDQTLRGSSWAHLGIRTFFSLYCQKKRSLPWKPWAVEVPKYRLITCSESWNEQQSSCGKAVCWFYLCWLAPALEKDSTCSILEDTRSQTSQVQPPIGIGAPGVDSLFATQSAKCSRIRLVYS